MEPSDPEDAAVEQKDIRVEFDVGHRPVKNVSHRRDILEINNRR
jgi:hypothetical protein